MSSLSSLSNWQPAARYAGAASSRNINPIVARIDAAASLPPSTVVTLSPEAIAAASAPLPTSERYKDMGAAMLRQLDTSSVIPLDHAKLPEALDNKFTLNITTRSGARLDLTLADVDGEMIYQVSSSAELNDDERKALSNLAAGFQSAIDGMAGADPQVRLGGLTQFDSRFVQSIDFHAEVAASGTQSASQTLDFHIDGAKRKVSIGGPSGQAEVIVDTGSLQGVGNKQQQAKAINKYLAQFDQAASRGHGDLKLMSMFKDAFSDMNRTSTTDERQFADSAASRWQLNSDDRSTLTGLSDFSASVSQTPKFSNPLKPQQKDGFSYEVSQLTNVDGPSQDDRTVSQSQQSHLSAQYHTALGKTSAPSFDGTPQTQNYEYHQIEDNAGSNVTLNYRHGKLAKAGLEQMASQSERVQTFILGKLKSDRTIPVQQSLVRDLLPSLTSYEHRKGDDTLNNNIFLVSSPGEIVARNQQF